MHFPSANDVFYNKVQVLNRDLSITMIRLHGETLVRERETKIVKRRLRSEWHADPANTEVNPKGEEMPRKIRKGVKEPDFMALAEEELKDKDWTLFVREEDKARKAYRAAVKEHGADQTALERPKDGLKIMDCLAASGLRSMRYFHEVQNVDLVTVNDLEVPAIGEEEGMRSGARTSVSCS